MSSALTNRSSANRGRGGIAKRRSIGPVRTDKDGDIPMGGPAAGARGGAPVRRGTGKPIPTGPRRGASGSGMAARPQRTARDPVGTSNVVGGFVEMRVTGWKESKGDDKGCILFLERKSKLKFRRPRTNDDKILVQVPLTQVYNLLEWDNAAYAGSHLKIESVGELPPGIEVAKPDLSEGAASASSVLQEVLRSRYNAEAKLLNLGHLINDPILQAQGFFVSVSTHTKLFPALMKVADMQFTTSAEKREKVESVTLEGNNLVDLSMVTTLSQTFPELQNLSLAGNQFKDWKSLDGWRWKFRKMQQLVLTGNPITADPAYRDEARRRYPSLVMLDEVTYPTPPVIGTSKRETRQDTRLPPGPMVRLPVFVKPNNIPAEIQDVTFNFLGAFFPGFDTDRKALLTLYYDASSTFSYAVNTSAPRKPGVDQGPITWEDYINKSRNLKRIENDGPRAARIFQGAEAIDRAWTLLPRTVHDSADPSKWCFDSRTIPVNGQGLFGVIITVHGEFTEVETVKKASGPKIRSFDRTFIIAPTPAGGIRVCNDMMTIRAWGGQDAWQPEDPNAPVAPPPQQQTQPTIGAPPPPSVAAVAAAAPLVDPQVELKKQMLMELMKNSGLTEEFATLCLDQTGWVYENAWQAFLTVQASGGLPENAFAAL